jgi:transcriptional regulator with XRE-family HTH domain
MIGQIVGANIRRWRLFRGYQQPEFARKVGVSVVTVSKYENGRVDISITKLVAIATILDITIEDLLCSLEKGKLMHEAA